MILYIGGKNEEQFEGVENVPRLLALICNPAISIESEKNSSIDLILVNESERSTTTRQRK